MKYKIRKVILPPFPGIPHESIRLECDHPNVYSLGVTGSLKLIGKGYNYYFQIVFYDGSRHEIKAAEDAFNLEELITEAEQYLDQNNTGTYLPTPYEDVQPS